MVCEQTDIVSQPFRLLIAAKKKRDTQQAWQEAWQNPQETISKVLEHLELGSLVSPVHRYDSSDCRFMAVERWDSMVFIVCDLFNRDYKHEDAHLANKNELPVQQVRMSSRADGSGGYVFRADEKRTIGMVGNQIREAHELHGWDKRVPFVVDHANGARSIYSNPRSFNWEYQGLP